MWDGVSFSREENQMRPFKAVSGAGISAVAAMLLCVGSASAAIVQQSAVKLLPTSGSLALKGKAYAKVDAYLSTRAPLSTRPDMKSNPVGSVRMAFPSGTTLNTLATVGCKMRATTSPTLLKANCASSQIGFGWALMNNLGTSPLLQIAGAPVDCLVSDLGQYSRSYPTAPPACTPRGLIWVSVRAYQGSGDGIHVTNRKAIIFANSNSVAALSFPGVVNSNVLSVTLPAMGGNGSQPGEFPFGIVLSDFRLVINKTNYLKMGTCPAGHRFTVTTTTTYSQLVGESIPAPAAKVIAAKSICRV
jgi:hypothetical protein